MRSIMTMAALVAAALPMSAASAQSMQGYTVQSTRLYSGPLRDYPSVRYVGRGARVGIYGCLRDWSWCDANYRGMRGWIAGNALRVSYGGQRRGIGSDLGVSVISFAFGSYWDTHYRGRRFYGERQRWQTQYDSSYRPEWGDREQHRRGDAEHGRGQQGENQHQWGQRERDQRGMDHLRPGQHGQQPQPARQPADRRGDGHGNGHGKPGGRPHE